MYVELGVGTDQCDAAEEARPDVVGMPSAIRSSFAGHHERQELAAGQRFAEQLIHGKGTTHRTRRTGTQAAAERHLLVDFHFDAEVSPTQVTQQIQGGHTGGVQLGIQGEATVVPRDFRDAKARLGRSANDDLVAREFDGETEHIEAASHVGHGGGRENPDFL